MKYLYSVVFLISISFSLFSQVPAFPGAEGGGMYATGGRGGKVYVVTKLTDDGSVGTLRYAVNQSGARIVVFRVAGTITLTSRLNISKGDLTIAGQTAPGDGICVRDYDIVVSASNVIIRYIRARLGNEIIANETDAAWGRYQKNIIIDHCSFSWSIDETASFYSNENFTMQWCFITESLNNAGHVKGAHGYGGIWGGNNATFHHNLIAYHNSRNPRFNGYKRSGLSYTNPLSDERLDFRNNVLYGWGDNSSYGGESGKYNIVNNYFKYGPGTKSSVRFKITQVDIDADPTVAPPGYGTYYINGNYVYGSTANTTNNWSSSAVTYGSSSINTSICKATVPFEYETVSTHTAAQAYDKVLSYAGCSIARDTVDRRIVNDARTGTSTFSGSISLRAGIIDTPEDVGGWPELSYNASLVPTDTDGDGMPNDWETAHNLNPSSATDASLKTLDSNYTNIEMYINELVQTITTEQNQGAATGINNLIAVKDLIYPNPVTNGIIKFKTASPVEKATIYNISGICTGIFNIQNQNLNLQDIPAGIYIFHLKLTSGENYISKVIIE